MTKLVWSDPIRRFKLVRKEDESGVSGTGDVARGAVLPDGQTVLWWTGSQSIGIYLTFSRMLEVHGHGGKTVAVFED